MCVCLCVCAYCQGQGYKYDHGFDWVRGTAGLQCCCAGRAAFPLVPIPLNRLGRWTGRNKNLVSEEQHHEDDEYQTTGNLEPGYPKELV